MENRLTCLKVLQAELDADRRRRSLAAFDEQCRAWSDGRSTLATLCQQAGDALESYSVETLGALVTGTATLDISDAVTKWIVEQYHDAVRAHGAALREQVADPSARHAVAQTLQVHLLRAESRLRMLGQLPAGEPEPGSDA